MNQTPDPSLDLNPNRSLAATRAVLTQAAEAWLAAGKTIRSGLGWRAGDCACIMGTLPVFDGLGTCGGWNHAAQALGIAPTQVRFIAYGFDDVPAIQCMGAHWDTFGGQYWYALGRDLRRRYVSAAA